MKTILKGIFAALLLPLLFAACDDDAVQIVDSTKPDGAFTATRSGSFVAENGTPTAGTAELGTDSKGTAFLRFGSNFKTQLATGTVTVYLSKSQTFQPDPANGNPNLKLVGIVAKDNEQFFRLDSAPASSFTHVILWCGSANVPFGYAALN